MSRRDARELVFKLIFEYEFNKKDDNQMFEEYTETLSADDKAYVSECYYGIINHYDELQNKISSVSENFAIERIFKVDLAILFVAVYEIMFINSIPYKVSVDEALNLAENYSTEKSVKFINGVLSKISK